MTISKLIEILQAHGGDGSGAVSAVYRDHDDEECRFPIGFAEILIGSDGVIINLDLVEGE